MADMFIKFDGVDGESEQVGYESWIEIQSFSKDMSAPTSLDAGGGAGVGKASIHGVNFMMKGGKHMPLLEKKFLSGQHFAEVTIHCCKQTGADSIEKYQSVIMKKVFISGFSSSKGEGSSGNENCSLTAEEYLTEHFVQDGSGALTSVGSTNYNQKTGVVS